MSVRDVLLGSAKVGAAALRGYGDDKRDHINQILAEKQAEREDNEARLRLGLLEAQTNEIKTRVSQSPVTYKTGPGGELLALPTRPNLMGIARGTATVGQDAPSEGLPAIQTHGFLSSALSGQPIPPAVRSQSSPLSGGPGSIEPTHTGVFPEQRNRAPSVAAPPVRTIELPDHRRALAERDAKTGNWDVATTAAGDTLFAPSPRAPARPDPVLSAVKAAQAQLDKQQAAVRSVLARRPRQSQYADPMTRMVDTPAFDEAMNNWRTDSTDARGSLQRAQDALNEMQSRAPKASATGGGRSGGGRPVAQQTSATTLKPVNDATRQKAKQDPAFAKWLRDRGYDVPPG